LFDRFAGPPILNPPVGSRLMLVRIAAQKGSPWQANTSGTFGFSGPIRTGPPATNHHANQATRRMINACNDPFFADLSALRSSGARLEIFFFGRQFKQRFLFLFFFHLIDRVNVNERWLGPNN